MNRGCLALAGLGLLSLLAFGVTLEAINDPEQLTAIPFTPWDFLTYSFPLELQRAVANQRLGLEGLELPREVILDSLRQISGEVSTEELIPNYKTR